MLFLSSTYLATGASVFHHVTCSWVCIENKSSMLNNRFEIYYMGIHANYRDL